MKRLPTAIITLTGVLNNFVPGGPFVLVLAEERTRPNNSDYDGDDTIDIDSFQRLKFITFSGSRTEQGGQYSGGVSQLRLRENNHFPSGGSERGPVRP